MRRPMVSLRKGWRTVAFWRLQGRWPSKQEQQEASFGIALTICLEMISEGATPQLSAVPVRATEPALITFSTSCSSSRIL